MVHLVEAFPPWQLEDRVQWKADGKVRKPPVDLKQCALKEMVQYACEIKGPKEDPKSIVVCAPVVRLFRQCANGLLVETSAWENIDELEK